MKRFYRSVTIVEHDRGHGVRLDAKPLRTPAKAELIVPSAALAEAIAGEWRAPDPVIARHARPLTRLACTAIDLVAVRRDAIIAETANYAATDLICYRAAHPPELVKRQQMLWQPLLNWLVEYFNAPLHVTMGITPLTQPRPSLAALREVVAGRDDMQLTALRLATAASGSLAIALALMARRFDADAAFAAAELDESFQIERWGEDPEQTKRRAALRDDLRLAERFAALLESR
jgi:chaperone required for assembly of F1-ATPase